LLFLFLLSAPREVREETKRSHAFACFSFFSLSAALAKASALGGQLPTFKKEAGGASGGKAGVERGGRGEGEEDGRLTLGQLARKGLTVDVSVTEPAKTAAEERACRFESERMARELQAKLEGDATYHKMLLQRQRLPAYEMQLDILQAVRRNQVFVTSSLSLSLSLSRARALSLRLSLPLALSPSL
jgi:hypothetical protein